jgi:hypothetical protein
MPVNTTITLRKGPASLWSSNNPVLASGEPGYDLTNNILKIGDGVSNWNNLKNVASISGLITASSGNFNSLSVSGIPVSVSGHNHNSSDITDFNSRVSGLLPVANISAGTNISITSSSGNFTINSTATGGDTTIRQTYNILSSQSVFIVSAGYSIGYLDIYLNGVKLIAGSDYTAIDGSSFTLTNSVPSGNVVEAISSSASIALQDAMRNAYVHPFLLAGI